MTKKAILKEILGLVVIGHLGLWITVAFFRPGHAQDAACAFICAAEITVIASAVKRWHKEREEQ